MNPKAITAAVALLCVLAPGSGRADPWDKVQEAREQYLPRTAIERLEPILERALAERAWPEAIRAVATKVGLEARIEGNDPEFAVVRMREEIATAPEPMRPVMRAILAHWTWAHFLRQRWRISQRTPLAKEGDDLASASLARILAEADRQFEAALANRALLKTIPVSDYDALLQKGTVPDAYRPTLFDFLAHEALAFYTVAEQAAERGKDAFAPTATDPILADADDFLAWEPDTADKTSLLLKAVRLYKELLAFHRDADDPGAFLDADLKRLHFGFHMAKGPERSARYRAALQRFTERNADHELAARAFHDWAQTLFDEDDPVQAHAVATRGTNAFPESFGALLCRNLLRRIEARDMDLKTERVWNEPWPAIVVIYRNIENVHFRAYRYDYSKRMAQWPETEPEQPNKEKMQAMLANKPDYAWTAELPPTRDYRRRTESLAAPDHFEPGPYFIFASASPDFLSETEGGIRRASVWVGNLALVMRESERAGAISGQVMHARTGEPLVGAQVAIRLQTEEDGQRQLRTLPVAETDANGLFRFEPGARARYLLHVRHGKHEAAIREPSRFGWRRSAPSNPEHTVLLTDRSLYRPGQTVRYKGLRVRTDPENDNYAVAEDREVTVVFEDVNREEVARQTHRSNAFGSFSGSFTIPVGRAAGRMELRTEKEERYDSTSFRVEEYRRPQFRVELDPPDKTARLFDTVRLRGRVVSYTGAGLGGATVRYRVERMEGAPAWRSWHFGGFGYGYSPTLTSGTVLSAPDGTFEIAFVAEPDTEIAEEEEPAFVFATHADATDTAGETRSAQRMMCIGYATLMANMRANEWQTSEQPVRIRVRTFDPNGANAAAEGTIAIHRLEQPPEIVRDELSGTRRPGMRRWRQWRQMGLDMPPPTEQDDWKMAERVAVLPFRTGASGATTNEFSLGAGAYRAVLRTQDPFGKPVSAQWPLLVVNPEADRFGIRVPHHVAAPTWAVEPGKKFTALWGTGYETGRAFIEIEHRGEILKAFWTAPDATQKLVRFPVDERMRGGFTFRSTFLRENRAYIFSHRVHVPWSNKNLTVRWERFVSKLEPGERETWSVVVADPEGRPAEAEMAAVLYDASLDAFHPHSWPSSLGQFFRRDFPSLTPVAQNADNEFRHAWGYWDEKREPVAIRYRRFRDDLPPVWARLVLKGEDMFSRGVFHADFYGSREIPSGEDSRSDILELFLADAPAEMPRRMVRDLMSIKQVRPDKTPPFTELDLVRARRRLDETAFFFPHLAVGNGVARMEFTAPEALTEWKFMGFAHDRDMRAGLLVDRAVTAKELMVQPSPPRFLREGDELEFAVRVFNQSQARQRGTARLTFTDARTGEAMDAALGNARAEQPFDIPAQESLALFWRLTVHDRPGMLVYKAVAASARLSDGEEGYLPVLPRRVLVTESVPLTVRGPDTRAFRLPNLLASGDSDTIESKTLTVQMTSNPAWYAVMALPYLMEFPHACSEQVFNRLFANALARHIAKADPNIRRVFDQWKNTPALDSPLERNEDIQAVMLEETPWLRQAECESRARRHVGILFDDNRLDDETDRALRQLSRQQLEDGRWPWFPGGQPDNFITLYIVAGFGRLRHLGATMDVAPALRALSALDEWMAARHRRIRRDKTEQANHLSPTLALYLYGRGFFLEDKPLDANHREAFEFFLGQARRHWPKLNHRQAQAHLAVALHRQDDRPAAQAIMRSIRERAVSDKETGMFWRDQERSWWWYRAPIETQAMMIEAFDEVMDDAESVEACRAWLLNQKRTRHWGSTKATADAVYALLRRGTDRLTSTAPVEVKLAGEIVRPDKTEAGTGMYERRFVGPEIAPAMGEAVVRKADAGIAWGGLHWQYLEDIAKIAPHADTPLSLEKTIHLRKHTAQGPRLFPLDGPLAPGDELVTRLVLRTDRDLEYVHLKDQRGSGTEPVSVLSQYRYRDGLRYYETTRDTATHFFLDSLPKGVYVIEYSTRVRHRGSYQSGMASVQCLYAPEFGSHSGSVGLSAP